MRSYLPCDCFCFCNGRPAPGPLARPTALYVSKRLLAMACGLPIGYGYGVGKTKARYCGPLYHSAGLLAVNVLAASNIIAAMPNQVTNQARPLHHHYAVAANGSSATRSVGCMRLLAHPAPSPAKHNRQHSPLCWCATRATHTVKVVSASHGYMASTGQPRCVNTVYL